MFLMSILIEQIKEKLTKHLMPTQLEVINESHQHNVPPGSESHFKIIIVSQAFESEKFTYEASRNL